VLDLYSNYGGFALHACSAGADEVVAVDSSALATRLIEQNCELNGLRPITTRTNDVFSELHERHAAGERFDVIIADPPPFARSKKHVSAARRKYVELFSLTLDLLHPDGVAFLASCSHHITRDTFMEMLRESLVKARQHGIILEERGAGPDHPVHPAMPETGYLHGAVVRTGG
jgi:23S rRNA (cytosine1962-C5)-methyltransferase